MSDATQFEFKTRLFVSGTITALTGLHIGGNSTEMAIGGADQIVVRDPLTNHPYIPGSSLRGKMRSLFERMRGEMTVKLDKSEKGLVTRLEDLGPHLASGAKLKSAGPASDSGQTSAKLFGVPIDRQPKEGAFIPQRLVVRDAMLLNADLLEEARNTDMPLTEVKTEVAIDRITSQANPRQIERVPAGAAFGFSFVLNLYGEDSEQEYLGWLFECMQLLQDDYLGGHGSRGYGRVQFDVASVTAKTARHYRENLEPEALEVQVPEALRRP